MFDLGKETLGQVGHVPVAAVFERFLGDADEARVLLGLTGRFTLSPVDHADQADMDDAPREGRRLEQHQDVERVAVVSERRRYEAEIVRKHRTGRQLLAELEGTRGGIELELVTAASRRLDDGIEDRSAVVGRESVEHVVRMTPRQHRSRG